MRFYNEIYIDSGSITGSFLGTSSYSISSSYALTASYVIGGSGGGGISTGGSGSFTGSFTGSFIGDGSGITGLTGANLPTLNSSQIFVGNISNVATAVNISGDATLSNSGILTLSNGSVETANIVDSNVTQAKLSATGASLGKVLTTDGSSMSWGIVTQGSGSFTGSFIGSTAIFDTLKTFNGIDVTGSINISGSIQSPNFIDFFKVTGSTVPSQLEGRVYYDTDDQALTVFNGITDTSLQVGQETVVLVRNDSGVTINNGSVVMITGTLGNSGRLTVAEAVLDGSVSPFLILGIATNTILDGTDGLVTRYGKVRGIDTRGLSDITTWVDGDVIYANSSTPTGLSKFIPASPNLKIEVGIVVHAASNGILFVDLDRPHKLDDLYNVTIASGQTGDLLLYNSSSGVWSNSKILSGSYQLTGSISGTLLGTSSYALTASYALNGGGSSGLAHWTESEVTYDSIVHSKFTPATGTNVGVILQPKGTGAVSVSTPDGTATGGLKRGDYAIDLQLQRSSELEVASGSASSILGGDSNTIGPTGQYSSIVGGYLNTVHGTLSSIATGQGNQIFELTDYSFIGGGYNNELGDTTSSIGSVSILGGSYNKIRNSSDNSVILGGSYNFISASNSVVIGGNYGAATRLYTSVVASSRLDSSDTLDATTGKGYGYAQTEIVNLTNIGSPIAPTAPFRLAQNSDLSNWLRLRDNETITFKGIVTAREDYSFNRASFEINGCIFRDEGAASTLLIDSNVVEITNLPEWSLSISANITEGALVISFIPTGASNSVRVNCSLMYNNIISEYPYSPPP